MCLQPGNSFPEPQAFPQQVPSVVTLRFPWNKGVFQSQEQTVAVPPLPVPPPEPLGPRKVGRTNPEVLQERFSSVSPMLYIGCDTLERWRCGTGGVAEALIRPRSQRPLEPIRGVVHNCSVLLTKKFNKF